MLSPSPPAFQHKRTNGSLFKVECHRLVSFFLFAGFPHFSCSYYPNSRMLTKLSNGKMLIVCSFGALCNWLHCFFFFVFHFVHSQQLGINCNYTAVQANALAAPPPFFSAVPDFLFSSFLSFSVRNLCIFVPTLAPNLKYALWQSSVKLTIAVSCWLSQ